MDLCRNNTLAHSNGSEILLMSILKLFVDTSVSFSAKGGNYYPPLNCEYSGFRFINEKEKMEKKKDLVKVVQ